MKPIRAAEVGDQQWRAGEGGSGGDVVAGTGCPAIVGIAEQSGGTRGQVSATGNPAEPEVDRNFPGPDRTPDDGIVVIALAPTRRLKRSRRTFRAARVGRRARPSPRGGGRTTWFSHGDRR